MYGIFSIVVTPHKNCRLKLLKLERIKDFLLMEDEFIQNQERLKPQEEKHEVKKQMNRIRNNLFDEKHSTLGSV